MFCVVTYLHSFSFFYFLIEFYIGEGKKKKKRKKDKTHHLERKGRIHVALALYWCLHMIVQQVFYMQALAFYGE